MPAQQTSETGTLRSALAEALPRLESAKKNKANPHFKSRYADLASVIEAIEPIAAHGLWFRQVALDCETGVKIETFYVHGPTDSELSAGVVYVPADKNNAHGFGSASSYARRYGLQQAFGLATEDDDGNAAAAAPPKRQEAHSKLKTQVRAFVHDMEGCGDWDTWIGLRESKETKDLIAEVKAKLPQWWEGGTDMPEEFVPLYRRIELLEANLADSKAEMARA